MTSASSPPLDKTLLQEVLKDSSKTATKATNTTNRAQKTTKIVLTMFPMINNCSTEPSVSESKTGKIPYTISAWASVDAGATALPEITTVDLVINKSTQMSTTIAIASQSEMTADSGIISSQSAATTVSEFPISAAETYDSFQKAIATQRMVSEPSTLQGAAKTGSRTTSGTVAVTPTSKPSNNHSEAEKWLGTTTRLTSPTSASHKETIQQALTELPGVENSQEDTTSVSLLTKNRDFKHISEATAKSGPTSDSESTHVSTVATSGSFFTSSPVTTQAYTNSHTKIKIGTKSEKNSSPGTLAFLSIQTKRPDLSTSHPTSSHVGSAPRSIEEAVTRSGATEHSANVPLLEATTKPRTHAFRSTKSLLSTATQDQSVTPTFVHADLKTSLDSLISDPPTFKYSKLTPSPESSTSAADIPDSLQITNHVPTMKARNTTSSSKTTGSEMSKSQT
ncbi:uncharacterized protein [Ambystoma mexicanum]|uniref:uncharacterized protein n=1 Tax=Ambystoma mexicanum TaxID=8296 RepID=UPI0037E9BD43